jgi:glycosyltransferase involved in cell wall biosynthesis
MRVVHLAPTGFGRGGLFGGGERYPLALARALARRVDCELVTFGDSADEWHEPGGLRVRVLRSVAHVGGHPAQPVAAGVSGALAGADVIHAHQLRTVPTRMAAAVKAVARLRRTSPPRLVVTDHGLGRGGWFGRFAVVPRLVDRFLTVSRFSAETLRAPPSRTAVVYGGVDEQRFRPDPSAPRAGVLFVGRLTPHKGVDRLIRAMPAGVPLTIVGTAGHDARPPERDYPELVRRLAAERGLDVRFRTAVDDDELRGLYRHATVVVLPSVEVTCYGRRVAISELLGLALVEAMASGTPVVASRVGGLPEVVTDGVTGYLVEPGDVAGLRERLEQLTGDGAFARGMGDAARDAVVERFTWDHCARRCLGAYRALIAPN